MTDPAPQENIEPEDLGLSPEDRASLLCYLEQPDLPSDYPSSGSEHFAPEKPSLSANHEESEQRLASAVFKY